MKLLERKKVLRILTPNGYSTFKGVTRKLSNNIVTIKFASGKMISATRDHRFFIDGNETRVFNLKVGDTLDPGETIIDFIECGPQYVYDVVETDQHKFIANGIVSHNCEFMGSSGTLISGATLKILEHKEPIFNHDSLKIYKDKKDNGIYAVVVDTSRGKGLDYCAFSVIDIAGAPYEQVATYRSNTTTPQDYAQIINRVAKHYNNAFVLIELNDGVGLVVSESLFWDYEYENILMTENAGRAGKKISSGFGGANVDRGLYLSKTTKAIGCSMLKLLVEQKQLIINDKDTIDELRTFSKKGQSYEAEEGKHDDMVMGLVLFAWLSTQEYFKSITDLDINQHLKELTNQDIEDYVAGMGIMAFSDGMSDFDPEYALL